MQSSLSVQNPSGEIWDSMSVGQRDQVRRLLEACQYVYASATITDALHKAALAVGCSYGKMKDRYYLWLEHNRDWTCLLDGRSRGLKKRSLTTSPAFVAYYKALCLTSQRSTAQAIDELYRRWYRGDTIPGYEEVINRTSLPTGWSRANLRRLSPSRRERTLIRQGIKASYKMLPQMFSSRQNLAPMQYVMFDDVWMDHLVHYSGKIARPLMLGCNDLCTGKRLMQGLKPRIMRKDGTNTGLGKIEMLQLVVGVLYTIGYNPSGTTLICEHGTAALSNEEESILRNVTNGAVTVSRSGLQGKAQVLLDGYAGRQGGNPRGKAGLESWHNPYHNLMAMLVTVGAMGHNHGTTAPEILTGQIAEEKKLIALMADIRSDIKEQAQHHIFSFSDYALMADQAKSLMNTRTNHYLNDWAECGFIKEEYRLSNDSAWASLSSVKTELMPMVNQLLAGSPDLFRTRKMSPDEAWNKAITTIPGGLKRISAVDVCDILAKHMAKRLRIGDGCTIIITDQAICESPIRYELAVLTVDGREKELDPDLEYVGFVNPFNIQEAFILDPTLRFIGTSRIIKKIPRENREAYEEAQGRVNARRARIMRPLRVIMEDQEATVKNIRAHNNTTLRKATQSDLGLITPSPVDLTDSPRRPTTTAKADLTTILSPDARTTDDNDQAGVDITSLF